MASSCTPLRGEEDDLATRLIDGQAAAKVIYRKMNNAINYLNSLGLHRIKPGLERISKILETFGDPHKGFKCIIIAGTNGKGSVAAVIASILRAAGFKVGLYTSPHLVRISERIKVNDREISHSDLSRLIIKIKRRASRVLTDQPTYFEVLTGVAFLDFYEKKVDYAVLEVGMGGRLDATNIVDPIVSVITNIHLDHTEYLGETIDEIAYEKAGVIKPGVPVVTGADGSALSVIRSIAERNSSMVFSLGKDFFSKTKKPDYFNYKGHSLNLLDLQLGLRGLYQIDNATLAIAAMEILYKRYGIDISEKSLRTGLVTTNWEGRMEALRSSPPMILDGAHNPSAAHALKKSLKYAYPGRKFLFLIGMLADKDHENFIRELSCITDSMIITEVPSERNMPSEKLEDIAKNYVDDVRVIKELKSAFIEVKQNDSTPVCVTGSLYLIGSIKELITKDC